MGSASQAKTISVRRDHACELCGQPIPAGYRCVSWTWFDRDSGPRTIRAHALCERLRRDRYDLAEWWEDAPLLEYLRDKDVASLDAWCGDDPEWPALRAVVVREEAPHV